MYRASWFHWVLPACTPALVAAAYLCLPQAEAKATAPESGGFNDGGAYLTLTPGAFVMSSQHDFVDIDPSYGWGFGGGYMFAPGKLFKGTIGGTFEHDVLFLNNYDYGDLSAHTVRAMPELRLGLGNSRAWGYGLIGAGLGAAMWSWNSSVLEFGGTSGSDVATGLSMQVGAGVQAIVYRNFFLGGEVDLDGNFFRENQPGDWRMNDDGDFSIYQISMEFMVGWHF